MVRLVGLVLVLVVAGQPAGARVRLDVAGTWEGAATMRRDGARADVAGVVIAGGALVRGTIAVRLVDAQLSGAYAVRGTVSRRRVKLRGRSPAGARLRWAGQAVDAGLGGRLVLRRGSRHAAGALVLARPTHESDGDAGVCDAPFFTAEVLARVLVPVCQTCHVPGGEAGATAFLVDAADVAGTQRRVARQIDALDPPRSRILLKPLGLIPHGGGMQLAADGAEATILRAWVDTVAAGDCGGPTADDPYSVHCGSCHGADARGDATRPSARCALHVRDAVRVGRGSGPEAMLPLGPDALPEAQLDEIVAHLAALCAESGAARPADLFLSNCAVCHGRDGGGGTNAGGISGPPIRCIGIADYRARTASGEGDMPAFSELAPADVDAIHGYASGFCP